jgi:hypothetical protein
VFQILLLPIDILLRVLKNIWVKEKIMGVDLFSTTVVKSPWPYVLARKSKMNYFGRGKYLARSSRALNSTQKRSCRALKIIVSSFRIFETVYSNESVMLDAKNKEIRLNIVSIIAIVMVVIVIIIIARMPFLGIFRVRKR